MVSIRGVIVCTHQMSKSTVSSRTAKRSLLQGVIGCKTGQTFFFFEVLKAKGEFLLSGAGGIK